MTHIQKLFKKHFTRIGEKHSTNKHTTQTWKHFNKIVHCVERYVNLNHLYVYGLNLI